LRAVVSRLLSVAIDRRVVFVLVAFYLIGDAVARREAHAQRRGAPRYGAFLKLFTPIESVFNSLYLIRHSFFYLRYCICDRIARFTHTTLKFFLGRLLLSR